MKKTLKILLFTLLFLLPFSRVTFAEESKIIKEQNGRKCVDLAAYYEEVNNTSQAITGKDQSPVATKRMQNFATLTNIVRILVGDSIYCINDEEAASKTKMLGGNGLLGMVDSASASLLVNLPTVSVKDHLAQEFVPGYRGNNATFAAVKPKCVCTGVDECNESYGYCKGKDIGTISKQESDLDWSEFLKFFENKVGSESFAKMTEEEKKEKGERYFLEYIGYQGPLKEKLVQLCINPCYEPNHSVYVTFYYNNTYTNIEEPSECPEGCSVCGAESDVLTSMGSINTKDTIFAYSGEIRPVEGQGNRMLGLTTSEKAEIVSCESRVKNNKEISSVDGGPCGYFRSWTSQTESLQADCSREYSLDTCINLYCTEEVYAKAREKEESCGRSGVSYWMINSVKYYATEQECIDDQDKRDEEIIIMDEAIDENNKDILTNWKRWFLSKLSEYLGFGKIDFNDTGVGFKHESGYGYLQKIKLDVLWSVTRNIAYLFFVVVMIVIGFMIMFRSKIGGQILVSVGNSIPRLVVCLLLVTFSFAISGIMLDIGKMSMNVVGNLMYDAQKTVEPNKLTTKVDIASFSNLTDQLLYHVDSRNESGSKDDELESIIREKMLKEDRISSDWKGQTGSIMGEIALRWGAAFLMSSAKESEFNPGDIISLIFPRLAKLMESFDLIWDILLVGLQVANYPRLLKLILWLLIALYASVKLFITIVTSYARIFVNVVLGPIQMALGAIPGNFNSVIRWFKSLAANILVFPVIVAILGFSQFLATAVQPQNFVFFGNQGIFIPEGLITIKGVLLVAGYLFAANAPKFVQSFMKVEEDRTLAVVGANIQKSASRMPLLGGVFGAK